MTTARQEALAALFHPGIVEDLAPEERARVQEIPAKVGGELLVWKGTAYIRQGHQLHRVTGRTAAEIAHDHAFQSGDRAGVPAGREGVRPWLPKQSRSESDNAPPRSLFPIVTWRLS